LGWEHSCETKWLEFSCVLMGCDGNCGSELTNESGKGIKVLSKLFK
jgi:hypothetical protein